MRAHKGSQLIRGQLHRNGGRDHGDGRRAGHVESCTNVRWSVILNGLGNTHTACGQVAAPAAFSSSEYASLQVAAQPPVANAAPSAAQSLSGGRENPPPPVSHDAAQPSDGGIAFPSRRFPSPENIVMSSAMQPLRTS